MKPSVTRALLLEQHEGIRRRLAAVEELAADFRARAPVREAFATAIMVLLEALIQHNRAEESLLEPLLREGDGYADQRVSRMFEEHVNEHELIRKTLRGHDLGAVAEAVPDLAETLRAHMEAEERTFLHARVLRD